jgi:hypothetical protein
MTEPCKYEAKIAMLEHRDASIVETLTKLEGKIDLILMQITKVAVHEVYHDNHNEAITRASTRIERVEIDTAALARETREFTNQVKGMMRMAYWQWGMMGTGLGGMMIKLLFNGG